MSSLGEVDEDNCEGNNTGHKEAEEDAGRLKHEEKLCELQHEVIDQALNLTGNESSVDARNCLTNSPDVYLA